MTFDFGLRGVPFDRRNTRSGQGGSQSDQPGATDDPSSLHDSEYPEAMAGWLRTPDSVKPGALMPDLNLDEQRIRDLVRFLEGLQ